MSENPRPLGDPVLKFSVPSSPESGPRREGRDSPDAHAPVMRATPAGAATSSNGEPPPRQKFVYILGASRCGSTVFETVLGSHPRIRATGEFHTTPFPEALPGALCSCGQTFDRCPFWSVVRERYRAVADFDRTRRGQLRFENYRSLPRTWLHGVLGTPEIREQARALSSLVRIIAQSSGKEIVSESSKNAVRGYLYGLARSRDFDVYYLHLVRDGRGYIHSQTALPDGASSRAEKAAAPPWVLTLRWVVPNLLAMLLCARPRNRYLRIRYEDFVERPAEVLERVGGFLGVDMTSVVEKVRLGQPFPVTHLVGGNRVRFNRAITLESRFADPALVSRNDRWSFWALGGWMSFLYGYLLGGRRSGSPSPDR